jgi:hypothetical protein
MAMEGKRRQVAGPVSARPADPDLRQSDPAKPQAGSRIHFLADTRRRPIFLADYTNRGDEHGKSHLVGVYINPDDLVTSAKRGNP